MADEEKPLPATQKRRDEARKQGQVARSPEFSAAATLLAIVIALHATLNSAIFPAIFEIVHRSFAFNPTQTPFTISAALGWQNKALLWAAPLVLPPFLLAMTLGVAVNVGQVGLKITPEALKPRWERINPAAGIKRLFSLHGLVELAKGLLKMGLIGSICWATLQGAFVSGDLLRTMRMPLLSAMAVVGGLLWTLGLRVSLALFLIAVADYGYQKYEFEKNLRMSHQDVKEENKQAEGSPEIKRKVRQIMRQMARRRMMQDVPKADVVITNPTHYAIALQYVPGASAPKVVAKGQDLIAQQIKKIARENRVPLVENRPLARGLHDSVEIGHEIPGELYEAVAQVLAFVYRTYGRRRELPKEANV